MPRKRNNELRERIGEQIRTYRLHTGMTQEELAEAIDVEPSTLSRYETGSATVTLAMLAAIASAVGVSLATLVDVDGTRTSAPSEATESRAARAWNQVSAEDQRMLLRILKEIERARGRSGPRS